MSGTRRADPLDGSTSRSVDQVDASPVDGRRLCAWCGGPIPEGARRDAVYCGVQHRQAAHRFAAGRPRRVVRDVVRDVSGPMRVCYADPPYEELSERYYSGHPDFAGEVDSCALALWLCGEFPDGWALSCSARSAPKILRVCPDGARLNVWLRGARAPRGRPLAPLSSFEVVITYGCRPPRERLDGEPWCIDSLTHGVRPRTTDPNRVVGAKPAAFIWWLFDLMGLLPGDELVDLFPGSGGVGRAWELFNDPSAVAMHDASSGAAAGHDASCEYSGDPSRSAEPDASRSAGAERRVAEDLHDASRTARATRDASAGPAGATRRLEQLDAERADLEQRHDAALALAEQWSAR